jgi:hypothetical protein
VFPPMGSAFAGLKCEAGMALMVGSSLPGTGTVSDWAHSRSWLWLLWGWSLGMTVVVVVVVVAVLVVAVAIVRMAACILQSS